MSPSPVGRCTYVSSKHICHKEEDLSVDYIASVLGLSPKKADYIPPLAKLSSSTDHDHEPLFEDLSKRMGMILPRDGHSKALRLPGFNTLPQDVRIKIWDLACREPRHLGIFIMVAMVRDIGPQISTSRFPHGPSLRATEYYPALMRVNREARQIAAKFYQPMFHARLGRSIYMNPDIDVLQFRNLTALRSFYGTHPQHLSQSSADLENLTRFTCVLSSNHGTINIHEKFLRWAIKQESLMEVTIIQELRLVQPTGTDSLLTCDEEKDIWLMYTEFYRNVKVRGLAGHEFCKFVFVKPSVFARMMHEFDPVRE